MDQNHSFEIYASGIQIKNLQEISYSVFDDGKYILNVLDKVTYEDGYVAYGSGSSDSEKYIKTFLILKKDYYDYIFEAPPKSAYLRKSRSGNISGNYRRFIVRESFSKAANESQLEYLKWSYESQLEKGKKFLAENSKKENIVTLESGLQYEVIKHGEGVKPTVNDQVIAHYHGTLIDGTVFDSSVDRGEPASFPVLGIIKGWTEALQLMNVGSKWRLFIPYDLAYGERGAGAQIAPFATLIFEIELISVL